MFSLIKEWINRYFSDPEAVILLLILLICFFVVIYLGGILAPVFAALGIAYVLDAIIEFFQGLGRCPRWLAFSVVYLCFIAVMVFLVLWLFPLVSKQFSQLLTNLPELSRQFHQQLFSFAQTYPQYISMPLVKDLVNATQFEPRQVANFGKWLFSFSLSSLPSIVAWLVYVFLVPLLVFFFLKDKEKLILWAKNLVSTQRGLTDQVCREMKAQLGNYVRGKVLEMVIVGVATYIGFWAFDMQYALLLAFFVGLSVFIPYVGMTIVTIPVVAVGLLQWGVDSTFLYMLVVYLVIQALDGNLLVPLLFSEAVNIHPVAIITAVLFFGGIWGFWGLFFAIPLATLVKSVVSAWYHHCQTKQFS